MLKGAEPLLEAVQWRRRATPIYALVPELRCAKLAMSFLDQRRRARQDLAEASIAAAAPAGAPTAAAIIDTARTAPTPAALRAGGFTAGQRHERAIRLGVTESFDCTERGPAGRPTGGLGAEPLP